MSPGDTSPNIQIIYDNMYVYNLLHIYIYVYVYIIMIKQCAIISIYSNYNKKSCHRILRSEDEKH